ncbi:uncharacterized protein LY89DRAFT_713942 [Mollisia scopiformis]|uniref:Integral membrane protein n=1 Tax=Mollisia scopiformis TaxID=149040 RepID=A0A194XUW2_MOLSC|nr:uncharacterized protein LY89DRAFT_713942 [Mollisia scopiformis]KUJ23497.1 integral membrane protein [Mollisia scopiformis]
MSGLADNNNLPRNQDVGPVLMAVTGIFAGLVLITTSCRVYVRIMSRVFGWDDAMILVTVAFALARLAVEIKQSQHGNGKHRVYLSTYDYMMINMWGWYAQVFLFAAVACLKVSIGFLILRIKDTKTFKILVYTLMAGVCFTNFGVVIILLAECKPAGFWRGSAAKCWPDKIRIYSIYATIAFSVTTDLFLSILPLFIVWRVRIPLRTKISVCCLMSLGLLATGFGIARAASLSIMTTDLSWMYCIAALWSNLELFLGIVCANLAIARSTYSYIFGRKETPQNDSYHSPSSPVPSSHSRFTNRKPSRDEFETRKTAEESRFRAPSESRSARSDIPLVIQKTAEFEISFEEEEMKIDRQGG